MFSPFIAFINGIIVNMIWLFQQEFTKKTKNLIVKVNTDFYKEL